MISAVLKSRYFNRANTSNSDKSDGMGAKTTSNLEAGTIPNGDAIDVLQVFLADGTVRNVRVDTHTTVKRIIEVVLDSLDIENLSFPHFALRLNTSTVLTSGTNFDNYRWLSPNLHVPEVRSRYLNSQNNCSKFRFELRIRFITCDLFEMYQTEMLAFLYFYDQLIADYLRQIAWKINATKAIEMAALMLRKNFSHITSHNLEKKLDFTMIECQGGLIKYLPEVLVINIKKKHLYKMIAAKMQNIAELTETECMFRFMRILADITPFNVEVFRAAIGSKWQHPVDLHVGHDIGIAFASENTRGLITLKSLREIAAVSIRPLDTNTCEDATLSKALVILRIIAEPTPMILTLPTLNIAESLAHLIDGYRVLIAGDCITHVTHRRDNKNNCKTIFSPLLSYCENPKSNIGIHEKIMLTEPKKSRSTNNCIAQLPMNLNTFIFNSNEINENEKLVNDVIGPVNINFHIIRLEELMGEGQFGNVYRGSCKINEEIVSVAVKVRKSSDDASLSNVVNLHLLNEAHIMAQLRHPHIIALIGICADDHRESKPSSMWMVMELADCGELRVFLQRERACLSVLTLSTFAHQIADALAYLHERIFVHGDVAARNCLVKHAQCVKLSDFGSSRALKSKNEVYTVPNGKLPIKWLPPESINQRAFSLASDTFMFGVCVWEIFSWGVKPWQGVRNCDVIVRVECGERLRKPDICPESIYSLLMKCWSSSIGQRPQMHDALVFLGNMREQIQRGTHSTQISVPNFKPRNEVEIPLIKELDTDCLGEVKNVNCNIEPNDSNNHPTNPYDEANDMFDPYVSLKLALKMQRAECEADDHWLEEEEKRRMVFAISINQLSPTFTQRVNASLEELARLINIISQINDFNHDNASIENSENVYYLIEKAKQGNETLSEMNNNINDMESCNSSLPRSDIGSTPSDYSSLLERADDKPYCALVKLIRRISSLSSRYNRKLPNSEFIANIRSVKNACENFIAQVYERTNVFPPNERCEVSNVQKLVESDLRKLNQLIEHLNDSVKNSDKYAIEFHRNEALRTMHAMAINGKSMLETIDAACLRIGLARLKTVENNKSDEIVKCEDSILI